LCLAVPIAYFVLAPALPVDVSRACTFLATPRQAGGKVLDAPAVEITYGLERILMARQGVKHFKDIR
jgi:glycyl-tRNA synthetase alpha subunit